MTPSKQVSSLIGDRQPYGVAMFADCSKILFVVFNIIMALSEHSNVPDKLSNLAAQMLYF